MTTALQVTSSSATSTTHPQHATSTAPVLEFVGLYTHDLRRKQKRWQDGRVKYHGFNQRVMVYDDRGNHVGDTHWHQDYSFGEGEEVQLERGGVLVQVGECVGSREQDLSELIDKRAQERAERQAAAAARRPPPVQPATTSAAGPPLFQLRHRPLHNIIGTPSGHHGRAQMPTESPFDERQRQIASPNDENPRPGKRRRRDISPPSKRGYAQSLFGATLTLSSQPPSSAPVRHQSTISPYIFGGISSSPPSDPVQQDVALPPMPMVQPPVVTVPRNKSLASKSKSLFQRNGAETSKIPAEVITIEDPDASSSPTRDESDHASHVGDHLQPKQGESTRNALLRPENTLRPVSVNRKLQAPIAVKMIPTAKSVNKHDQTKKVIPLPPLATHLENPSPPKTKHEKANRQHDKGGSHERAKTSSNNTTTNPQDNAPLIHIPVDEPRTELRIRPTKKRGLLMIAEKSSSKEPPVSKAKRTRPSHSNPQEPDLPANRAASVESMTTLRHHTEIREEEVAPAPIASPPEACSPRARVKRKERNRKSTLVEERNQNSQSDDPFEEMDLPAGRERAPTLVEVERDANVSQDHVKSSANESRSSRRRKKVGNEIAPSIRTIDSQTAAATDEQPSAFTKEHYTLPEAVPAPRLVRFDRKSIRSREVIGFIPDDDWAFGSDVQQDQTGRQGLISTRRQDSVMIEKDPALSTETTRKEVHRPLPGVGDAGPENVDPKPRPRIARAISSPTRVHSAGVDRLLEANGVFPNLQKSNSDVSSASRTNHALSTTMSDKLDGLEPNPIAPPKLVNPATRGRKAAKPSDAVGQVPQCPLPPEVGVQVALGQRTLEADGAKSGTKEQDVATSVSMPGFVKANGGPWSREANDLFEFTRPS